MLTEFKSFTMLHTHYAVKLVSIQIQALSNFSILQFTLRRVQRVVLEYHQIEVENSVPHRA